MTRLTRMSHQFVEFVPKDLQAGVLYISIPYDTSVHLCACGCGSKITTPIRPAGWSLKYDGESVSLSPSIGNWSYPCQSHYWIRNDRIDWAPKMSKEKIAAGRERDRLDRERHSAHPIGAKVTAPPRAARSRFERFVRKLWPW